MKIVHFVDKRSEMGIRREAKQLATVFQELGYQSGLIVYDGAAANEDEQFNFAPEDVLVIHFDMHELPYEIENHDPGKVIVLLQDYVAPDAVNEYGAEWRQMFADSHEQLVELIGKAVCGIAHVNKGVDILADLQAHRVRKIPVYIDDSSFPAEADTFTLGMYKADIRRMLFVGEVDTESGVDDLYKTFWYYRQFVEQWDQKWQLLICGDHSRCESYSRRLKELVQRYELEQFLVTHATGLSPEQLTAMYQRSDVLVSFDRGDLRGEDLLRSIQRGMPVIGYAEAAAEDILGDGELIVNPMTHSATAERLALLQTDADWSALAMKEQKKRLENFRPEAVKFLWSALLSRFITK